MLVALSVHPSLVSIFVVIAAKQIGCVVAVSANQSLFVRFSQPPPSPVPVLEVLKKSGLRYGAWAIREPACALATFSLPSIRLTASLGLCSVEVDPHYPLHEHPLMALTMKLLTSCEARGSRTSGSSSLPLQFFRGCWVGDFASYPSRIVRSLGGA